MTKLPDLALGSYEAAAVLGVHFTRPARMAAKGEIVCRMLHQPTDQVERDFLLYSLEDVQANYDEYMRRMGADGSTRYRPRAYLHERDEALKRLATAEPKIIYDDAIGSGDACRILDIHPSLVHRMCREGKLVFRQPWNPRSPSARFFILSRRSVERWAQTARRRK